MLEWKEKGKKTEDHMDMSPEVNILFKLKTFN